MAETVKVEIDLLAGKLGLECAESSVDPILTRLIGFLPKLREQAQLGTRQTAHHQREDVKLPQFNGNSKTKNGSTESGAKKRPSTAARAGGGPEVRPGVQSLQLRVDEPGLTAWNSLDKDWRKYL